MNKSTLRSPEFLVVLVLVIIGILAGLVGFKRRFSVEARNKRVETVVDFVDAQNLAVAGRTSIDNVLVHVKEAGITSLALTEDTVDSLRNAGALRVVDESSYQTVFGFAPSSANVKSRLEDALTHKTGINFTEAGQNLVVSAPYFEIDQLGLGLDPGQVSTTVRNDLYICPRLSNFPGANSDSISWMLNTVKAQCGGKATTLIFTGLDVLGDRNNLRSTADVLDSTGLRYGSVEFGKQIGDDVLTRLAAGDTVRVHSIGGNEMPTMDIPTAIGRFGLAARERSIRVCYIRFFIGGAAGEPDVLKTNYEFMRSIRQTITQGGLALGPAHPYSTDPRPGKILFCLMALGVAAGGLLLVRQFTGLSGTAFWCCLAGAAVAGVFLASRSSTPIGRELLALAAAMTFPTLGLLYARPPEVDAKRVTTVQVLLMATRLYAAISATTFVGVLFVVGLLADRLFMLKVYEFAGIRLAVFMPILLVCLYYALNFDSLPDNASWRDRKATVIAQYNRIMLSPLLIGQVLIAIVGLAIVAVILLRSGNDPGIGVSLTELGFRALLSKVLSVRPRTKEFLFGHPFLVFGLAMACSGRRKLFPLFLIAGAIGQSSLLNTFCHIHTPLVISVARALLGLVLGGLIGAVGYVCLQKLIPSDNARQLATE